MCARKFDASFFCSRSRTYSSGVTLVSDLLTIKQVTNDIFGDLVSTHSVRRWIAKGVGRPPVKLRAIRLGRDYFVERADAEQFRRAINNPELYRRHQTSVPNAQSSV